MYRSWTSHKSTRAGLGKNTYRLSKGTLRLLGKAPQSSRIQGWISKSSTSPEGYLAILGSRCGGIKLRSLALLRADEVVNDVANICFWHTAFACPLARCFASRISRSTVKIKLAGMAGEFYRQRVGQHLEIGLKALEKLKVQEWARLHSRKLRSFAEVAFQ